MKTTLPMVMLVLIASCGESPSEASGLCRPQEVMLAECLVREWEKHPAVVLLEQHKFHCRNLYPFDMCYYR
jgi:hypothetical protein